MTNQTSVAIDKPKFHFSKSQFVILKNSLLSTLKSKFYIITTSIFVAFLLVIGIVWSQILFKKYTNASWTEITTLLGFVLYVIAVMIYLFIFNLTNLIKFFGEQKQNGIYDLEIRKGKSITSIFFQRLLANKVFSFGFIIFSIGLYYLLFSFTNDYVWKDLMINFLAPGLWFLLVFDTLITALILIISLANKIKLTASIISILAVIILFFPLFTMLYLIFAVNTYNEKEPNLTTSGQLSLHYAKEINEIRYKYENGILDKMIQGDKNVTNLDEGQSFDHLGDDQWVAQNPNPDVDISLGIKKESGDSSGFDYNLNTELLFNGLIHDSQNLLTNLGVKELIEEESNPENPDEKQYLTYETKYVSESSTQKTYFYQFFANNPNLFIKNGQGYSVEEWQNTIFNIAGRKDYLVNHASSKPVNPNAAINYLQEAMDEIFKKLTGKEKDEWKELQPIILDAFKSIYIFNLNDSYSSSPLGYLSKYNIFSENSTYNNDDKFGFGVTGNPDSYDYYYKNKIWFYPVLTLTNGSSVDSELKEYQKEIFQAMTVKPGTRQLISIMASLISNSLVVPYIFEGFYYENDNGIITSPNFTTADIQKVQTKKYLYNPFSWIYSMLIFNKTNLSVVDNLKLEQRMNIGLTQGDATSLKNYYVNISPTQNFSNSGYDNLITAQDISTPNFNWEEIQVVTPSFSPLWALLGSLLTNLAIIGVSYWLFKVTLIK